MARNFVAIAATMGTAAAALQTLTLRSFERVVGTARLLDWPALRYVSIDRWERTDEAEGLREALVERGVQFG